MTGRPAGERSRANAWGIVGTNAGIKFLVMGLSAVFAVATTRLIIANFGLDAYAQYGLLTSMAALLPFADLGLSAAVINTLATATAPRTDDTVRRTLVSVFRILIVSAFVISGGAVVLTALGLWHTVLGEGLLENGGSQAAMLCLIVFGVTLPFAVGQRILTGLGKNHVRLLLQSLVAPFIFLGVLSLVLAGIEAGNQVPVVAYLGSTFVAVISLTVAARKLKPQLRLALTDVPRLRSVRGSKVMDVAWPLLAQMVALPIAMQTDRLLLSHLSSTGELAQYNLAAQLFGIIVQTVGAAGISLWPVFARARARSEVASPYTLSAAFFVGGLTLAIILGVLTPWIAHVVSDGLIVLDFWLVVGFIAFVALQAAKYPLGMYMTDARGLRFQVLPILILVPVNLALSWVLIAPLGAAGPVIGSAISVALCQVLPNLWYVRRDLARRVAEARDLSVDTVQGSPGQM